MFYSKFIQYGNIKNMNRLVKWSEKQKDRYLFY